MKATKWVYWIATGLVAAMMGMSGVMYLVGVSDAGSEMYKAMTGLGYPAYLLYILGVAKLLGAIALSLPKLPARVREWAYAGFTFNLLGAVFSHLLIGDGKFASPLFPLALLAGSYFLWARMKYHLPITIQAENMEEMPVRAAA